MTCGRCRSTGSCCSSTEPSAVSSRGRGGPASLHSPYRRAGHWGPPVTLSMARLVPAAGSAGDSAARRSRRQRPSTSRVREGQGPSRRPSTAPSRVADFPLVSAATISVPGRPVRPGLTLGLLSLQHALIHGQSALYPIVFLAISPEFGIGAGAIAVLAAVGAISTGMIQLTFGALTRRFSKRSLLGVGGMAFGIGTAAQAVVSGFAAFVPVNVASRLGGAPQHPVGNALLTEQYAANRWGTAISAHIAGGNIGTLVMGVVATGLVALYGWRSSVLLLGILALIVAILVFVLIQETHATAETRRDRPTVRD